MTLSVRERGETIATLRHIHVRAMEILAGWTPTTPEMEVKLMFGGHIWDVAQHADAFGKRTYELRMPLQHSQAPINAYDGWLDELRETSATEARIGLFYGALLPSLAVRYSGYLARTDSLLDAPSVRIIERVASEQARMMRDAEALLAELPKLKWRAPGPLAMFAAREAAMGDIVAHREPAAT